MFDVTAEHKVRRNLCCRAKNGRLVDLVLWEDYLQCIELNRKKKYRAVKNYARYEICSQYSISEKTFYSIRDVLSYLCDDVN